jgi:hypothetical protein
MERIDLIKIITRRRRRAFSLIAVLVIAIAGLALVGGILHTFQAFSGASMQVMSSSWEYNYLQEAVEQGKAFLRDQILALDPSTSEPLKWKQSETDKISNLRDLLIRDRSGNPIGHRINDRPISEKGLDGTLNLYIYSMAYVSDDFHSSLTDAQKAQLPPSLIVNSGPGGGEMMESTPEDPGEEVSGPAPTGPSTAAAAYLIRATFTDKATGNEKSIETAIVQSMRE